MTRKPTKAVADDDRLLRILEAVLLALCLCVLALRVTYTEAPTAQMASALSANLTDSLYSLTVSSLLVFAFALWLVVRAYSGRFAYHTTGMEFGLALFVAAAAIAAAVASDKRVAITQAVMLASPIFAALLLAQILNTNVRVRLVLVVVVALGVVSAYQCAEQWLVSNRISIEQYEQHPEIFLDPLGIEPGTFQQFLFEHRLYSRGIRGYFTTSNSAASFSIMASFAALVLLMGRRANRQDPPSGLHPSLWPGLATLMVIAGLLLTKSKGGILAFAAGLILFGALVALRKHLGAHRRLVPAVVIGLVLLLAGLAGNAMVEYGLKHGSLPGGNSMLVRWQYWTASARMYADHPWTGIGLGNFSDYYPQYKPDPALESISDPHNILLSLIIQCGPLGLLGFLAMAFVPLWRLATRSVEIIPPESSALRKPALRILFVVLGALIVVRPMLMPPNSEGGDAGVFLYAVVTLYIAPAAAFLVGFMLITAPLEMTAPGPSRFARTVLSTAMTCSLLAVLLHNLIDFAIFEPGVWMTFWVVMACLIAGNAQQHPDSAAVRQTAPAWRVGVIAAAVVLMGVYYLYVWRPVWSTTVKVQDAMAAASAGQFDRAHAALDAASAADPLSSTPANFNGRLYLQQYEMARQKQPALLDRAAQYLRQAVEQNPADYKNYEKLAQVCALGQRWQDAYDWYLKATERYPGCERLWFRLAQAAEQLGKPEAALGYYIKAVQIEEAYQQQFRRMYPTRDKVISRLGDRDLTIARKRIEELSGQSANR